MSAARWVYRRALELEPNDRELQVIVAHCEVSLGRRDEARRLLGRRTDTEALVERVHLEVFDDDYPAARELLAMCLGRMPLDDPQRAGLDDLAAILEGVASESEGEAEGD
jgi:hypothetical protein